MNRNRAERRANREKSVKRMLRVMRDSWGKREATFNDLHWRIIRVPGKGRILVSGAFPEEEKAMLNSWARKLADNPKACGGHCCNWTDDVKGQKKRAQREFWREIEES